MENQAAHDDSDISRFRVVTCPSCKGDSVYHSSNPARPFCSPRCKSVDLGAWANEDFRVASPGNAENSDLDTP